MLDTSHCYIGTARYEEMVTLLPQSSSPPESQNGKVIDAANAPDNLTIVGIDENTALIIDLAGGCCSVRGPGGVIIIRNGSQTSFTTGEDFAVEELGPFHLPSGGAGIDGALWAAAPQRIAAAQAARTVQPQALPAVQALVDERESARQARRSGRQRIASAMKLKPPVGNCSTRRKGRCWSRLTHERHMSVKREGGMAALQAKHAKKVIGRQGRQLAGSQIFCDVGRLAHTH